MVPGHLPGANGLPTGTTGPPGGGGSSSGHVSVADAIASLEGGKSATYPGAYVCAAALFCCCPAGFAVAGMYCLPFRLLTCSGVG